MPDQRATLHRVSIAFGVSLVVRGVTMDRAGMLGSVTATVDANGIEVSRAGNVVWFTAEEMRDLSVLAAPLADWWQQHEPTTAGDVAPRFVGPNGVTELGYSSPDLAVEAVQRTIEVDSGRPYAPGEAPSPLMRLTAVLLRRVRIGFTASEVSISDEHGVLCVAMAGRDLDDRPRSVELQALNPEHDEYDPDDEGYCLVNENHVPIYGGLVALRLTGRTLRLQLTREAARAWGIRSAIYTVRLRIDQDEIEQLRHGLRRLFSFGGGQFSAPILDL